MDSGTSLLRIKVITVTGIVHIVDRHIQLGIRGRHPKVNASLYAAPPYISRPTHLSFIVRVKRIHGAILMAGKQDIFISLELNDKNTGTMIKIWPILRRTVRVISHHAGDIPGIATGGLTGPHSSTGRHINRKNRI